jgi:hypothetical protein
MNRLMRVPLTGDGDEPVGKQCILYKMARTARLRGPRLELVHFKRAGPLTRICGTKIQKHI